MLIMIYCKLLIEQSYKLFVSMSQIPCLHTCNSVTWHHCLLLLSLINYWYQWDKILLQSYRINAFTPKKDHPFSMYCWQECTVYVPPCIQLERYTLTGLPGQGELDWKNCSPGMSLRSGWLSPAGSTWSEWFLGAITYKRVSLIR